MRARREVEVDTSRQRDDRVPIVSGEHRGYDFGEPGLAIVDGEELRGVIAWDPELRWVLIVEDRRPAV